VSACVRRDIRARARTSEGGGEGVRGCDHQTTDHAPHHAMHSGNSSMETRRGCARNTTTRQEGQPVGGVEAGYKQLPVRTERRRVSSSPRFATCCFDHSWFGCVYSFVRSSFIRSQVHPRGGRGDRTTRGRPSTRAEDCDYYYYYYQFRSNFFQTKLCTAFHLFSVVIGYAFRVPAGTVRVRLQDNAAQRRD